jgi:hypothetical protein
MDIQDEDQRTNRGEGAGRSEVAGRAKSSENQALQGNSPTGLANGNLTQDEHHRRILLALPGELP